MDDLISRQAAIDALSMMQGIVAENGVRKGVSLAWQQIKDLPSAHPLNPCETCLYKGKGWDEEPCDGCTGTESKYEPERKKGKWEEREVSSEKVIDEWQSARCSVCGKYHTTPYMYYFDNFSFCPNCGADMRGENNGK